MTEPPQDQGHLSRKLAAVMCVDAVDYSRLMGISDEETHLATEASIKLFRTQVEFFGGRILEITGDGVLADFGSAVRAVESGVSIQRELRKSDFTHLSNGRLEFRIGITLGDVAELTGKVFGSAVNLASRIEALSPPGELCVTGTVYDQIRHHLPVTCQNLGQREIKGFEEPIALYRVSPDGDGAENTARIRKARQPLRLPQRPSIAVLPFEYLGSSTKPEFQLFGDGISEEITTRLSKYKELFVIARNSALVFKDRSVTVPEVASALGVQYVVEGSVRAANNRTRVAAQLVDAVRGNQIWADTYDGDLSDLFEVQDEVSKVIVATVAGRLVDAERLKTRKMEPMELEAYGWLLKGQDALLRYNREGNVEAQQCLQKAIQISPDYARAYAALSRTYHYEWQFRWGEDWEAALQKALDAANKAVALDAEDPHGYAERGFVYLFMKQGSLAISELRRAHDMNPNDADLMAELADALIYGGQLDEAVVLIRRAMRLNPYYPDSYLWYLADAYYALHRYEDTISAILQMHNPNAGRRLLAASYGQLGQLEMARKQAEEVLRLQPDFTISAYAATQPETNPLELEHFLEGLRKAGLPD